MDDDGGNGLLSRLLLQADEDLRLAVAVSTFPDLSSSAPATTGGRYSLYINTYRGTPIAHRRRRHGAGHVGQAFKFQGQARNSVFVNSNGSLSFGDGDTSFAGHRAGVPGRAAADLAAVDRPRSDGRPGQSGRGAGRRQREAGRRAFRQRESVLLQQSELLHCRAAATRARIAIKWGPTARGAGLVGMTQGGRRRGSRADRPEQARTAPHRDHVRELPVQHLDARGQQLRSLLPTTSRTSSRKQYFDVGSVAQSSGRPVSAF